MILSLYLKAWESCIVDLFSDTYTLRIQYEYSQTQCVVVAKEVNNKRISGVKESNHNGLHVYFIGHPNHSRS